MSKSERQATVESLAEQLRGSPNLYVTDFSGLSVLRMTEFRRRLRAAGVTYVVVKNTLAQRALAAQVTKVAFDRGPSQYHGRVAALAQAAREAGLGF